MKLTVLIFSFFVSLTIFAQSESQSCTAELRGSLNRIYGRYTQLDFDMRSACSRAMDRCIIARNVLQSRGINDGFCYIVNNVPTPPPSHFEVTCFVDRVSPYGTIVYRHASTVRATTYHVARTTSCQNVQNECAFIKHPLEFCSMPFVLN